MEVEKPPVTQKETAAKTEDSVSTRLDTKLETEYETNKPAKGSNMTVQSSHPVAKEETKETTEYKEPPKADIIEKERSEKEGSLGFVNDDDTIEGDQVKEQTNLDEITGTLDFRLQICYIFFASDHVTKKVKKEGEKNANMLENPSRVVLEQKEEKNVPLNVPSQGKKRNFFDAITMKTLLVMEEEDSDNAFEDLGEVSPEAEKKMIQEAVQQTQLHPIEEPKNAEERLSQEVAAIMKAVMAVTP